MMDGADDLNGMLDAFDRAIQVAAAELEVIPSEGLNERFFEGALGSSLERYAGEGWVSVGRQHTLGLPDWPGVGRVDLTLEGEGALPLAFVELKWDDLLSCSWDMAKLALGLAREVTESAFLVAGAPVKTWEQRDRGAQLFDEREWRVDVLLERFGGEFAHWRRDVQTYPRKLPSSWHVRDLRRAPTSVGGQPWELRSVRIEVEDPRLVAVSYRPAAEWVSEPELESRTPSPVKPLDFLGALDRNSENPSPLLAGEGGVIRCLDPSGISIDEGVLADLDPDAETKETLWFASPAHRRVYAEQRGWRIPGDGKPELFDVGAGSGLGSGFSMSFDGRQLTIDRRGWHGEITQELVEPTPAAWKKLWRRFDHLDVWSWAANYQPKDMATDGYGWEIEIVVGGRRCRSSGYMAYPDGGFSESSATWDAFLLALGDLTGGVRLE